MVDRDSKALPRTPDEAIACWDREYSGPHPKWKGPPRDDICLDIIGRVLELGCGNGKTAGALVRKADRVVALDFSRRGLEACRSAVPSPKIDLLMGDIRFLPLADHMFDGVVASHVLGHLIADERRCAVREIIRVLAPGGTLLVRTLSVRDMRFGQGQEIEPNSFRRGTGIMTHFFDEGEMLLLMADLEVSSLEEIVTTKRYGGQEHARAEWRGSFQKPAIR